MKTPRKEQAAMCQHVSERALTWDTWDWVFSPSVTVSPLSPSRPCTWYSRTYESMKRSSSSISWERVLPASDDADATDEFSMATSCQRGREGEGGPEGEEDRD